MQIVNGYVCQTCCDVAAAKAGKDPAHPNAPPGQSGKAAKPGQTGPSDPTAGADPTGAAQPTNANRPAVTFGGVLAQVNGLSASPQTSPPPPSTLYSGGLVNVSA
jgi:hypothetical protein